MRLGIQIGLDGVEGPDGVLVQMRKVIVDLLDIGIDLVDFLVVLLDIEERDSPDGYLEQAVDVVVRDLAHQLVGIGSESRADCLDHGFLRPLLLYSLIDALLDEDALEGSCMQLVEQMSALDLQFLLGNLKDVVCVIADDIAYGTHVRQFVADDQTVDRNLLLAERVGIEGVHHILGVCSLGQGDLDVHGVGREIVDALDLQPALLDGCLDGLDHLLAVHTVGKLLDDDLLGVRGIELGPDCNGSKAVLIVRDIHDAAAREIRVELEGLALDGCYLGIDDLVGIVGQDLGGHSDSNALGALDEDNGDLGREDHGFLVSAVVGLHVLGDLGVVEDLLGKGQQAALDVSGCGRTVACHEVSVVTLLVDEEVVVCQVHQGRVD